jgi:hypothetical protein
LSNSIECDYCRLPETVTHCFFHCEGVRPLWQLVEAWVSAAADKPVNVDHKLVVHHLTRDDNVATDNLLMILCSELKLAIWQQRNRRKFEEKNHYGRHQTPICIFYSK